MKYALVTGCDHGVGLELASQLTKREYTVAACRINPEERLIDALAENHPDRILVFPLDISDDRSVKALASGIPFPHLDLLINNAGILGRMEDGPDEDLDFDLMQKSSTQTRLAPCVSPRPCFLCSEKGRKKRWSISPQKPAAFRTANAPDGLATACPKPPTICREL